MDDHGIHRAVSADGTEIVGRVIGQGPELVLVHGGLGDGELTWQALLPLLADRFTCYTMSTRGRGLSAVPSRPDYRLQRMVEDVAGFIDSIGRPVGLAGYSSGGMYALAAAAACPTVSAVAVFEPPVLAAGEEHAERFAAAAARVQEHACQGRLAEAARSAIEIVAHDDELAALEAAGAFEAWARNVPVGRQEIRDAARPDGPNPLAPEALAGIAAPVLYLHGSRAHPWYRDGGSHLREHVADLRVAEVPGVGHFGPLLVPQPVADALIWFFEATLAPVSGRAP
jgi:pimeloyl-ACP methyl ester carboxylesterase